jgi:hypothetical protein
MAWVCEVIGILFRMAEIAKIPSGELVPTPSLAPFYL